MTKSTLWLGLLLCASPVAAQEVGQERPPLASAGGFAEDVEAEEIVVSAGRVRGSVRGNIPPQVEMTPADIASYGVGSIDELLLELAPQTTSASGGSSPVVLLNGRRIANFLEIRNIPTEAIRKVEILPEEVALRYGYRPDQKVVNFVLRERFRTTEVELEGAMPTDGGTSKQDFELNYLSLTPHGRLNLSVEYERESALFEDERDLIGRIPRQPYATPGNIMARSPGAEIDPALSQLAGGLVTVAGVPAAAANGVASLADFATLAGTPHVTDTRPWRTLLPKTSTFDANAVYATTIFSDIAATFNGRVTVSDSRSGQGLADVSLPVPATSPWSPFSSDVTLYRYLAEFVPLTSRTKATEMHLGFTLGGDISDWEWSLTGNYDRRLNNTYRHDGPDLAPIAGAIMAGEINPFAPLDAEYGALQRLDRARTLANDGNMQFVASGTLVELPAGPLTVSTKVGGAAIGIDSWSRRDGEFAAANLSRTTASGQGSFDLPLSSRRDDVLAFLGDVSVNFNLAWNRHSDFGGLRQLGYGVAWTPRPPLSLIFSVAHEENAPGIQQLGDAETLSSGVRVFDYVNGETVDVTRLSGGNPDLLADNQRIIKLGATLRPLGDNSLSITASYDNTRIDRPIAAFPTATAAIEAAFPGRFVRDATGNLLRIDARPINFARRDSESLRYGFTFSKSLASPAPREGESRTESRSAEAPRIGRGGRSSRRGTRLHMSGHHNWSLNDEILVHESGPLLDLLHGDAIGSGGGQPRHTVDVRAGITHNGLGLRLSGKWQEATTVRGGRPDAPQDLRFSDLATINMRLFANLGSQRSLVERIPFLRGARASLSVDNVFNRRMRVTDAFGDTPVSYQPAYMDAMGRTVEISLRKLFLPPRRN